MNELHFFERKYCKIDYKNICSVLEKVLVPVIKNPNFISLCTLMFMQENRLQLQNQLSKYTRRGRSNKKSSKIVYTASIGITFHEVFQQLHKGSLFLTKVGAFYHIWKLFLANSTQMIMSEWFSHKCIEIFHLRPSTHSI